MSFPVCFGKVLQQGRKPHYSHPRNSSFFLFAMDIIGSFLQLGFFLKLEINNIDVYKMFWKYNHQQLFLFSLICKFVSTSFLIVL